MKKRFFALFLCFIMYLIPAMAESKESLSYLYAGTTVSYLKMLEQTQGALHTVCPDYFDITPEGNLLITPKNKIDAAFISELHRQNIRVTPFISNHWNREAGIAALNNRQALSSQIAEAVALYQLDGIDIDIENVNESYRDAYTDFARLLREKLPPGKSVSVAVAANPKGWQTGWHGSYDYKALSDICDYLMIMTYDESYQGSAAGPVSSGNFFEGSIQYALNCGVPREKIVTGLPFFGRYWKEGEAVGGYGISTNDIAYLLENYSSESRYNEGTKSNNAIVTIVEDETAPMIWGGRVLTPGTYNIWYDSVEATGYKLTLIHSYGLRGAGSWALGQENTEVWRNYATLLNGRAAPQPTPPTPPPTETVPIVPPVEAVPQPAPSNPAPEPAKEDPLQQVLRILNNGSNPRTVTAKSLLTRGEFAVMLAGLCGVPASEGEPFADTSTHFSKGQIQALKNRGILVGSGGKFYPDDLITREELVTLLNRILVLPNTIDYHSMTFRDVLPARWSYYAIAEMNYYGLVKGYNADTFAPTDKISAETFVIILRRIGDFGYAMNADRLLPAPAPRGFSSVKPYFGEPIIEVR